MKTTKTIKRFGYIYHLNMVTDRHGLHPQPCFMGIENYALKKVTKDNGIL